MQKSWIIPNCTCLVILYGLHLLKLAIDGHREPILKLLVVVAPERPFTFWQTSFDYPGHPIRAVFKGGKQRQFSLGPVPAGAPKLWALDPAEAKLPGSQQGSEL